MVRNRWFLFVASLMLVAFAGVQAQESQPAVQVIVGPDGSIKVIDPRTGRELPSIVTRPGAKAPDRIPSASAEMIRFYFDSLQPREKGKEKEKQKEREKDRPGTLDQKVDRLLDEMAEMRKELNTIKSRLDGRGGFGGGWGPPWSRYGPSDDKKEKEKSKDSDRKEKSRSDLERRLDRILEEAEALRREIQKSKSSKKSRKDDDD